MTIKFSRRLVVQGRQLRALVRTVTTTIKASSLISLSLSTHTQVPPMLLLSLETASCRGMVEPMQSRPWSDTREQNSEWFG